MNTVVPVGYKGRMSDSGFETDLFPSYFQSRGGRLRQGPRGLRAAQAHLPGGPQQTAR